MSIATKILQIFLVKYLFSFRQLRIYYDLETVLFRPNICSLKLRGCTGIGACCNGSVPAIIVSANVVNTLAIFIAPAGTTPIRPVPNARPTATSLALFTFLAKSLLTSLEELQFKV